LVRWAVSRATISRLQLLAAALLFSTGGAAIKATTLDSWQVACFRSGAAVAAVLVLAPASRKNWTWRVPVVGLAYAATMVLFVASNKLTTSANAIFLQDTAPLYLLLFGPWLLKEAIRKSDLILMAVLALGMSMFFIGKQMPFHTAPDPARGNLVAVVSGITWALTIAGLRWLEVREHGRQAGMDAVAAGNAIAFLACLPKALPVAHSTPIDWLTVAYLGVFQIGLAYVFLTRAVRRVPALEASLLLLAEPALNPVWTWAVHGERPNALALVGGALIIAGTAGRMLQHDGTA